MDDTQSCLWLQEDVRERSKMEERIKEGEGGRWRKKKIGKEEKRQQKWKKENHILYRKQELRVVALLICISI